MTATVLNALIEAERRRESVALVTLTEGEGTYAELPGRHLVVWADDRPPVGDLVIPVWQADVVDAARAALAERRHRQARFAGEQGAVTLFIE
ncbi:MAG: hypothetical protein KDE01_19925, partial [Caldilineaceae bacterium]|nr:hypothetical protein [Caldilineaceae bacterium]